VLEKPANLAGLDIAVGLKEYCEFMQMVTDLLEILGADGTKVNTGWQVSLIL
jgi:hypothetical protein